MVGEDQVLKDLWNDFGIPGARRVYRKSNLRRDTECSVHRSRDILIEWDAHTRIDTVDTLGNDAGADVAFAKKLQLKCHRPKSLFKLGLKKVGMLSADPGIKEVKTQ